MSEIELVFRRAERRCSGSLFSMLLFKKLYLMQIFKINCLATTLYEVFNRLQAFLFLLLFWGINEGIKRKHMLHSWVADQNENTGFLPRSWVPPQRRNGTEIK